MVAGTVAWAVSYWNAEYNEGVIYQVALAGGLGLAGFACWRWTTFSDSSEVASRSASGPIRYMAAAALVLAVGFAAITYQTYDNHRQFEKFAHGLYPHYRLIIAGGGAIVLGLLLAAIGFLVLAKSNKVRGGPPSTEVGNEEFPM